jgi:mRNA-degrading endonuclease RelE of RelBE toxin-antitoxin system
MPPYQIERLDSAQVDVRAVDRETAMRIFEGILHFTRSGSGEVRPLHGPLAGSFRLRVGDHRILFKLRGNVVQIFGVRHRSKAYRE